MSMAQCDVCDGYVDTDADDYHTTVNNYIICMNCVERENEND